MQNASLKFLPLALCAFLTSIHATAEIDMDAIKTAEFDALKVAMCPSASPDTTAPDVAMDDYSYFGTQPAKVFDNFYFIGMENISAWALTTSEGIILFEAMMVNNWEQTIENGLKELGLDPADIKYVVLGHAHNDHWGGAYFLQQKYGAKIIFGEPDWNHMLVWPQIGTPAPFPARDRGVVDGDSLTLGDTTVRFVATPGHTPGTISSLIPLKDGDDWHLAAYWGGPSMSFLDPNGLEEYIGSTYKLQTADPDIDVELTNHPWADGTLVKIDALANRKSGDPHPFVSGNNGVKAWLEQLRICTREVLSSKRAAQ